MLSSPSSPNLPNTSLLKLLTLLTHSSEVFHCTLRVQLTPAICMGPRHRSPSNCPSPFCTDYILNTSHTHGANSVAYTLFSLSSLRLSHTQGRGLSLSHTYTCMSRVFMLAVWLESWWAYLLLNVTGSDRKVATQQRTDSFSSSSLSPLLSHSLTPPSDDNPLAILF